tara:strand:+ start:2574 stop:3734 length:1161 start_codon:yes stop_codon:yes gene_type:complete
MANWYWNNAEGSNSAGDLGNWVAADGSTKPTLASHLTTGDLIFRSAGNIDCTFDIATCNSITTEVGYTANLTIATNVAIKFATLLDGIIKCGSAQTFSFSDGTSLAPDEGTFVEFGDDLSYESGHRTNLTFEFSSTQSTPIKLSDGLYPKVILSSGKFSTQYVTPNSSTHDKVDMYALTINSGASFEQTAINNINVNDKNKNFYLKTNTFTISTATFHCGESNWTLQGHTSSATTLPFFNSTITNFRMRKLILDKESGAGSMFAIPAGANLTLDSLTINEGVVLLALDGCIIRSSSKPNIKGSWGFLETSEGIYLPKDYEYLLGTQQGGTGIRTLGSSGQILTSNGSSAYWASAGAGSSSVIDIGPLTSASSPSLYSKVVFGSLTV